MTNNIGDESVKKKRHLYQVTSYHHFLVALARSKNDVLTDIIITDTPVGKSFYDFYLKVKNSKLFNKVYWYDELEYKRPGRRHILKSYYYNIIGGKKHIQQTLGIDLNVYDEIYMFDDYFTFGSYLINDNIKYHLLEDTCNSYVYCKRKKYDFEPYKYFWMKVLFKIRYTHPICGNADCCVDIEVSKTDHLPSLPKEKLKIVDRNMTIKNMPMQYRKKVLEVFGISKTIIPNNSSAILILSQPFYAENVVQSEEIQRKLYDKICELYSDDYIVLKPHPRDPVHYYSREKFIILDRTFPIEILQYMEGISFSKAITFTSTAINSIDFVQEKICLGEEKLMQYIKECM